MALLDLVEPLRAFAHPDRVPLLLELDAKGVLAPLEHLHLGPEPDQLVVDRGTPEPGPAHEEQRGQHDP